MQPVVTMMLVFTPMFNAIISAYAELESVTVTLVRGPGNYGNVSAQLTTSDVTARLGLDYFTAMQPVSVWFLHSELSVAVSIGLVNDGLAHPAKQFSLHLTGTTGFTSLYPVVTQCDIMTCEKRFVCVSFQCAHVAENVNKLESRLL